ncbi:hypothetical protein EJ05DRAFT_503453 [Pseudovirgaria hyperparasitica]|uniref:Uncharacterized protein n=1 Tax=Pseudovirgaria hyperparasitica TaxID=470096 RepID=A0A6A6VY68_9PEZI|nr:uncharacterized protein EJ05DRAFT_503453 [Pseudovirgaria hyperparasitica]KAF2755145.1 hypothetical protein EJ05DRAFT_503453 [Pseudovirgaria hyperparasitica]
MAQGAIKKKAVASKKPAALGPKRGGNRVIAPKKSSLIKKQKIVKKNCGALTAMTEKSLAQKAGHLELLAGGKKDKKKAEAEKKTKK